MLCTEARGSTHLTPTRESLCLAGVGESPPKAQPPEASPGEEPVDVAVSVPPSLEIDGETGAGNIRLTARIRYALRITDDLGLANIHHP